MLEEDVLLFFSEGQSDFRVLVGVFFKRERSDWDAQFVSFNNQKPLFKIK